MPLKPVESLALVSSDYGWSSAELERKQALLLAELLTPHVCDDVIAVYAHDAEAMRARCSGEAYRYLVERYDPADEQWLEVEACSSAEMALAKAKSWAPIQDKESLLFKWDKARDRRVRDSVEMLRAPFPDKVALAEFWYDIKTLSWPENYGQSPWEYAANVAGAMFMSNGLPSPSFAPNFQEKLLEAITSIESEWVQEKFVGALLTQYLGSEYAFAEGSLIRRGQPVFDGGFGPSVMDDLERDVSQKAVAVAAAIFDGRVWESMGLEARSQFLAHQFAVTGSPGRDALSSVAKVGWTELGGAQRATIGRQLGGWIVAGRMPEFQLSSVFGHQPLSACWPEAQLTRIDAGDLLKPMRRVGVVKEVPAVAPPVVRGPGQSVSLDM